MRIIKILFGAILLTLTGFMGWMSLTPGYFQYDRTPCCTCGGEVSYLTESENVRPMECSVVACIQVDCSTTTSRLINRVELLLANVDFNK